MLSRSYSDKSSWRFSAHDLGLGAKIRHVKLIGNIH
jgi:hypothetical protein